MNTRRSSFLKAWDALFFSVAKTPILVHERSYDMSLNIPVSSIQLEKYEIITVPLTINFTVWPCSVRVVVGHHWICSSELGCPGPAS